MLRTFLLAFVQILALFSVTAGARLPLKDASRLIKPLSQPMLRLRDAKIVYLHYDRLKRDFPQLLSLSYEEIDQLVLGKTGFVSPNQAKFQVVNSKIEVTGETIEAHRPAGYGRAVVFNFLDGMIDAKGSGQLYEPEQEAYKRGVITLGEALREDLVQNLTSKVLHHAGYAPGTVECYGVIDPGFDVTFADGTSSPAGIVLRQAHERPNGEGRSGEQGVPVEKILRRYGMTSAAAIMNSRYQLLTKWDGHNVQFSSNGAVFDFGSVIVVDGFASSPVNPDPYLRVDYQRWGGSLGSKSDRMYDNVRVMTEELARKWRSNFNRSEVSHEFLLWLESVETKYRTCAEMLSTAA